MSIECKVPTFPGVGVVIHDPLTPMDPDMTPMTGAQAVALMTGKGSKATELEHQLGELKRDLDAQYLAVQRSLDRLVSIIISLEESRSAPGTAESTPPLKR